MTLLLNRLAGLIAILAVTALSAPAAFAQTPTANILVVDMVRVQEQSLAAKSVQAQVREFETKLQDQAKKAEEKLKAQETGLKQQQTLLAPEQFDAKRREFENKVGEEQRKLQQTQQDLQVALRNAQGTLLKTLEPILKEIMTERGANIMIDRRMVLLTSSSSLDVTDVVVERLDKKLPTLKVVVGKAK